MRTGSRMARWEVTLCGPPPRHVRHRTLVSSLSVLPARSGAGAGGHVRRPVSATDAAVVLGRHPLPDPASRADPHHRLAREGGDGFHAAPRILRDAAEDDGTVAPVVQLSLLGWDGGAIRGEHGTPSRAPLVGGTIPIFFHCVLATFLFVVGRYHTRPAVSDPAVPAG